MDRKRVRADQVGGVVAILVGITAIREAVRLYPYRLGTVVGDHLLFAVLGGLLIVFGVLLIFIRQPGGGEVDWPERQTLRALVLTLGSLLAYRLLLPVLGYPVSTFLISVLLYRWFGSYRILICLAAGALTTAVLYVVFLLWLGLSLPGG